MKSKIILGIILIILLLPLIQAEVQTLGTFKQGECVTLIQTCSNCTYVYISSVIYPNSTNALGLTAMSNSGIEYTYDFCSTNVTGNYITNGYGDVDGTDTVFAYNFKVTPNGEDATIGQGILYGFLLLILICFLIGSISLFAKYENLLSKVGMLGLSYLLLIAITFVAWNMAKDFITSSPFLISMLNIMFIVLVIGFFPLVIGAFAWYFIMLFKIKEIENLMKHGFSEQEAHERVRRKHGKK